MAITATIVMMASGGVAKATTIFANNTPPGDTFTNAGGANQGQAIGVTGWHYNNVRNNGAVGISSALPRSGAGSVYFTSPSGTAKADIEFLASPVNVGGNFFAGDSLFSLSSLGSFGYDWYRVGTSTNPAIQHPALRVLVDRDGNLATTNDRGGLVFERAYNGGVVPVDQWNTDLVTDTTFVWNFGLGLGSEFDLDVSGSAFDDTLLEWKQFMPNAVVLGFSAGVGSGWNGAFTGAVDNINWTVIGGPATTNNFEVQAVPAPATLPLLGAALLGLGVARRRISRR